MSCGYVLDSLLSSKHLSWHSAESTHTLRLAEDSQTKRCDLILYRFIPPQATLEVKANSSALLVTWPSLCQEEKSFTYCSPSEYRHSLLPSSSVLYSFLTLFSPLAFFTSSTPAVFHLNISSSCLAASAACQVSSRSQGPTLKWSMEVIFRGVCVRRRETKREKGKGWDEKE